MTTDVVLKSFYLTGKQIWTDRLNFLNAVSYRNTRDFEGFGIDLINPWEFSSN